MKEERQHQHRFPQLITVLCKAIDIKQTKPEQANTVDINQSIKSPSDSCSQCQICCLSFSVLSLNVQPCWARAYSSLCLCVMCVLCFMCICVFVYLRVFICLFVCACLSVSPHAIHQIPNVNVRLPTKNQLGFNEARTPCAPHWTLNTHCTNTAQSCNTQQNTKTTPKLLCSVLTVIIHAHCMLHTVDAASTKCTAETWPTAQCALVHLQNNNYTALDNKRTHCTHYVLDCFLSTHLMSAYCVNALAI